MTKIQFRILSFFLGIPIGMVIGSAGYCLLFIETAYGAHYRFPKLSWLAGLFFDGNHYDTNGRYYVLILAIGICTAYKLLIYFFKPAN